MIEIKAYGFSSAKSRLAKFARAMAPRDRAITNKDVGIQLHTDVIQTFRAQGATQGRPPWAPLKAGGRYVKTNAKGKKRRFQTHYQILQDTGTLRQSFVPLDDENYAGVGATSLFSIKDRTDHADLAPIHEFGVPARNLPARPMLPTPARTAAVVRMVYGLAIEKAAQP